MSIGNQPAIFGEVVFLSGSLKGKTIPITKGRFRIGRQPDGTNDLVIPESTVSRHHAEIIWSNNSWYINKLSPQNSVFINKREVLQNEIINNRSVIGLGPNVEILFLSFTPEKTVDPGTTPTIYNSSPKAEVAVSKENSPFKNPGHSAWQVVGIISGISGIISAMESGLQGGLAKIVQISTAGLALCLCAIIVWRASKQAAPAQKVGQPAKPATRKALLHSLLVNVALVIALIATFYIDLTISLTDLFSPVTTQQQNTENILGITALIFFVGMLISLITIILQIMRSFRKKLLKRSSALWISAATSAIIAILIGILIAINISFSNSLVANISAAVGLGLFVLGLESLLVFIIVGINMLVIYLSGLSSTKSNVSLP